jgi:hypothetical protein
MLTAARSGPQTAASSALALVRQEHSAMAPTLSEFKLQKSRIASACSLLIDACIFCPSVMCCCSIGDTETPAAYTVDLGARTAAAVAAGQEFTCKYFSRL